ncbi:MAG: hypothetical protein Q8Q39_04540 [bacterium]|nr:hypothetical protein [bacterium]
MGLSRTSIEDRYAGHMDADARRLEAERRGKEIEEVFCEFLMLAAGDIISSVRHATQTEDHEKIDFVATFKNGDRIALQLTCANSTDIRMGKIKEMVYQPTVGRLYDEQGIPERLEKPIPRLVIYGGKMQEWEGALDGFKKHKDPKTYFTEEEIQRKRSDIFEQLCNTLRYLRDLKPDMRSVFDPYLSYLESAPARQTA